VARREEEKRRTEVRDSCPLDETRELSVSILSAEQNALLRPGGSGHRERTQMSDYSHDQTKPFLNNGQRTKEGQENMGRWEKQTYGTNAPQQSGESYDAYMNRINAR